MVFKGKDAEEYMRICDHPDLEIQERGRKFDEEFSRHAKVTYGPNGEVIIETDQVDFDLLASKK